MFVLMAWGEAFPPRFHQGEASFERTEVCKIVLVCIQKDYVARTAAVGKSWRKYPPLFGAVSS
ncbi:MAG: hypothetical protein DSZ23_03320 [Thermodesulfatator sp.]|nr:MAG: hypothetical protein DSZ23_03320 [Thermodesulfatator sp.]